MLETFMDIEELNEKGNVSRRAKKYNEALKYYEEALKINPCYVPSLIGRGLVLRSLKRYDEALRSFNKAIDSNSKSIELLTKAWNSKGLVLRNLKRYDEALEAFKTSINIDQENAFSWNGKGLVCLSLGKYNEAIKAYDTSLSKKQKSNETIFSLNGKGVALANLNKYDKSIETFEESIRLNPNQGFPWNAKGLILYNLKQFDEARELFKISISSDPKFIPAYNSLTMLYLEIGDLKKASSTSDDAFFKDIHNYDTLFLKGKIELEKLNYDSAIYYFKEAILQNFGDSKALYWEIYVNYLKAEVIFGPNDKKYQDTILSCIRELEKVGAFSNLNSETKYFASTNYEGVIETSLRKIQYFLADLKSDSDIINKALIKVNNTLLNYNCKRIESYKNYFLGCCYYKLNDYFLAKDKFMNCIMLDSKSELANSAKQIVEELWNYRINTPIFKWWLNSPLHRLRRIITFLFLLLSIFVILIPESSYLFILFLYSYISNYILNPLLPSSIYEFFSLILRFLFLSFLTLLSFIDWENNTTQYALLVLLLFFFLIYPCIKSFKSSEVEIEMQSPNPFELTPGLIEINLKELEKYLRL